MIFVVLRKKGRSESLTREVHRVEERILIKVKKTEHVDALKVMIAANTENVLDSRPLSKGFPCVNSFTPYSNPMK